MNSFSGNSSATIRKRSPTWYLNRIIKLSYLHIFKFARSILYHAYFFEIVDKHFDGLNLGCGGTKIRSFCNIDAVLFTLCDVVAGIDRLKLRDNSVNIIYNSHVFEHIARDKATKVLREWYRVLESSGKLYISVPDLEVLFKIYLDNIPFYNTQKGKYLADRACYLTYGGQTNKYDFHFYGYSFITLKELLESVGFKNVQYFDRDQLNLLDFDDISTVKIDGVPISLNVEATK